MASTCLDVPGRRAWLTTDHAASSYGLPVLVLDDHAYGPADRVDDGSPAGCTADDLVRKTRVVLAAPGDNDITADEADALREAFLV